MAKSSRTLTGATKNLYFERVLEGESDLDRESSDRLLARLTSEVALVTLKAGRTRKTALKKNDAGIATTSGDASVELAGLVNAEAARAFDPYSPNVIVVIRTKGREAVLAELHGIVDVDSLRLLAREQQLGIEPNLSCADDIRLAIVAAAERRIANRRAAAS